MHSGTIKQLEERHVANEIELMLWNDRMDLVALANIKGEVLLHRLSWQRVWSLPPAMSNVNVKGMVWRPDGKVLAIAYSTGKVMLVDVENRNVFEAAQIEVEITCLVWVQEKPSKNSKDDDKYAHVKEMDDSSHYLHELPSLSEGFASSSKTCAENLINSDFVKNQSELNMLIIGTKSGIIRINIFGLFTCGVINLSEQLSQNVYSIINAHMSDNLDLLYVTARDDASEEIHFFTIDTAIFKTHACELFGIALKYGHLTSLIAYLNDTMSAITEAWETILLEMDSKLLKYASSVPEGAVSADFLDLLMFGTVSDEMEAFLLQDLTDKGLKKLGHSIEMTYVNIQKLVLKNLTHVGQSLTYHLADLRGMARFRYRYQCLGLDEASITEAIRTNGAFLVKGVEVQQVINHSMINYKAFFRWLYVVILRLMDEPLPPEIPKMAQQDLVYITEFLQNFDGLGGDTKQPGLPKPRFYLECLGQYLFDSPLTILPKDEKIWSQFLSENESLARHSLIVEDLKTASLVQMHRLVLKAIQVIFNAPKDVIGGRLKIRGVLDVGRLGMMMCQKNLVNDSTCVAFVDAHSAGVYVYDIDDEGVDKMCYIHFQNSNHAYRVVDIKFYSVGVISFLLQEDVENQTAVLCQIPLSSVQPHMHKSQTHLSMDNKINAFLLQGTVSKAIDGMTASKFGVSGSRRLCIVLSDNKRKIRLFEMEAEEEEEDEDAEMTASTVRESDTSVQE